MQINAPLNKNTVTDSIDDILGQDGLLSRVLKNYEFRAPQLKMAKAVKKSLDSRRPLIVEAATGTGKTLAYLVPALLSQKRVIVSTGTKALQGQLFDKDLPFLRKHWPRPFDMVQLKGRRNYLCLQRFEDFAQRPHFRRHQDAPHWAGIEKWAAKTATGDRAEIPGLPEDFATWNDLSVGSEQCLGQKCPHFDDCFVFKARERAQEADIIVVNHHLYFADLALQGRGFANILPEYDAVIFDEAHHLEDVATSYFGIQVSNYRIRELVGDIERALVDEDIKAPRVDKAIAKLDTIQTDFFSLASFGLYNGRYALQEVLDGPQSDKISESRLQFGEALGALQRAVSGLAELGETRQRLTERCHEVNTDLAMILGQKHSDYAYLIEKHEQGVFLQAEPINLSALLREQLLDVHDTLVFTSATLATGGDFDFFKKRLGMSGPGAHAIKPDELILEAVFDYQNQCALYIPKKLPPPSSPDFADNVATIVEYLVGVTQGRAFILFTSYANMNAVYDRVAAKIDYTVLKQGEASKSEILEKFRTDTHSVLFATSSFWEGVDVEGEALSLVILDKLPFTNPSDPLTRARLDDIESRGGNSFRDFSMPQAALTLKQGFGRLIRSRRDVGIVAILDSRIANKSYGAYFLDSLPPAPLAWSAGAVKRWWQRLHPAEERSDS